MIFISEWNNLITYLNNNESTIFKFVLAFIEVTKNPLNESVFKNNDLLFLFCMRSAGLSVAFYRFMDWLKFCSTWHYILWSRLKENFWLEYPTFGIKGRGMILAISVKKFCPTWVLLLFIQKILNKGDPLDKTSIIGVEQEE